VHAATDPLTWAPATAAGAIYAAGVDQRIIDWATTHNPVYGSVDNARDWSDGLRAAAICSYYLSLTGEVSRQGLSGLLAPGAAGVATGLTAAGATSLLTSTTKTHSKRMRPDLSDRRSFPSGHTSTAAVHATLASRSFRRLDPPAPMAIGLNTAAGFMAAGTAWARVEGDKHYLSDVLAGAALGHFVGAFLNDLFLGTGASTRLSLKLDPSEDNRGLGARLSLPLPRFLGR
jgi:membrane-associated phospholipid phosphatase